MTTRAPFPVTSDWQDLTAGLTNASTYAAQNAGPTTVQYTTNPTNPETDATPPGMHTLQPGHWISFMADSTDPVWVRVSGRHNSTMVISDA